MNATDFASKVNEAAQQVPAAGRVGSISPRVWIHNAWAVGRFDLTLDEFKAALVECNRLGLVRVGRCDQVEAFDKRDVRRSTVEAAGATFNFIRL